MVKTESNSHLLIIKIHLQFPQNPKEKKNYNEI